MRIGRGVPGVLQGQAGKYGLEIVAYCLITNHVRLVAIPHEEESLTQAVGRTHFRYTQHVNRFHSAQRTLVAEAVLFLCFLNKLETRLGRRVRPLPVGRPKKTQAEDRKVTRKRK
jgi:hypothetical protein